jgi:hypothetical protein
MRAAVFLLPLPLLLLSAESGAAQRPVADCREWTQCRRLALEAAERHDYETFHDLAWRAIQTGPRQDPALMYLLARAQALSGRPHDALVMIQRLAEMGIASDAPTNADFERVRILADWPAVAALIERVGGGRSPADLTPSATDKSSALGAAPERGAVEQAVRISTPRFAASGLAYDAVSGRFVVGDRHGRKLIIVQDGADHAVDLVGAASAGFHEIRAIEIDTRQGDLWVATATADDEQWSLHRLQLVSGRPLKTLPIDAALGSMKLVDLAVTPSGSVLAVDAAGKRLLELKPKATNLQAVLPLVIDKPTSLAATNDGAVYVAGAGDLQRIDLRNRTAVHVSVPRELESAEIERIRCYGDALLAVVRGRDGARRLVRLDLNASGHTVTAATLIDRTMPANAGPLFTTVSGDYLSYVVSDADPRSESETTSAPGAEEFVVRRIRLR